MQRRDLRLALPHVLYWCGDSEIVVVEALRDRFAVSQGNTQFSPSLCHVMFVRILVASGPGPLMSFSRSTFAKTGTANGNLNTILALLRFLLSWSRRVDLVSVVISGSGLSLILGGNSAIKLVCCRTRII